MDKDGNIFEGNWLLGKREGKGKLKKGDTIYEGMWSKDRYVNSFK